MSMGLGSMPMLQNQFKDLDVVNGKGKGKVINFDAAFAAIVSYINALNDYLAFSVSSCACGTFVGKLVDHLLSFVSFVSAVQPVRERLGPFFRGLAYVFDRCIVD